MIRASAGAVSASVEHEGEWSDDDRPVYRWRLSVAGEMVAEGADLRGGCGAGVDELEMLRSLGGFLGVWREAHEYGGADSENRDLFPPAVYDAVSGDLEWLVVACEEGLGVTYVGDADGYGVHVLGNGTIDG